ncbi:hypothetical protein TNCV_1655791 [Trichonephila clavipes]|nr:hypothetical protein TNCV_1655791 [Trichonephila clavipes]
MHIKSKLKASLRRGVEVLRVCTKESLESLEPAQVSPSSLDHGSELQDPSLIASRASSKSDLDKNQMTFLLLTTLCGCDSLEDLIANSGPALSSSRVAEDPLCR